MTDPGAPPALATALAYHQAWTSHHLDQAMTYIADDIACDAPGAQISGAAQYRDFLGQFMTQLTDVQTVAAFGDDTTAVLFYYPHTATVSDATHRRVLHRRRREDHPQRAGLRPALIRPAATLSTGRSQGSQR